MKHNFSLYDLIQCPILTEKSAYSDQKSENKKKYFFYVSKSSNKSTLSAALNKLFDVEVEKVNIINTKGKVKKFRGKLGKRSNMKKAVFTLKPGFEIDFTNIKLS